MTPKIVPRLRWGQHAARDGAAWPDWYLFIARLPVGATPPPKLLPGVLCQQDMTPATKAYLLLLAIALASASAQQYVAFDAASATSTYSAGNLAGSSAFAAQQALSGGSGYWRAPAFH